MTYWLVSALVFVGLAGAFALAWWLYFKCTE